MVAHIPAPTGGPGADGRGSLGRLHRTPYMSRRRGDRGDARLQVSVPLWRLSRRSKVLRQLGAWPTALSGAGMKTPPQTHSQRSMEPPPNPLAPA